MAAPVAVSVVLVAAEMWVQYLCVCVEREKECQITVSIGRDGEGFLLAEHSVHGGDHGDDRRSVAAASSAARLALGMVHINAL